MASAQNEPDEVPGFSDLRIVLLGVSGAGKSSTGNAIMGRKAFKESRTRESEIQRGRVEDRNISIIDTPGFFNTHLTEEEMKKQMMKSLDLSDPGPHVFLLVVNLENFRENERNIVEQIQENFGEESLLFTMALFIGREKISKREFNQIIESEETQKILNYFEARFHVINNNNECDSSQISKLLKSIDNMVKNNGGQNYSNEIYLKNQIQLRETLKQEEEKKQEQKKEINTMEYVKTKESMETETEDSIKYQEDMSRESREPPEHKHLRDKSTAVREDHRIQIETWREKQRVRWELERGMTPGDVSKQDLRIVVLGKSGAGKTATRNIILDRKASFVKLSTKICKTKEADVCGRTISIIDTPGFLDDSFHNDQLKAEIERYVSAPGPHVFLLVISLWYSNTMENTVQWFQENIEQDALNHTIILFTSIDWMSWLKYPPLDEYIKTNKDVKSLIDNCGGRYHSLNNKDRQNRGQVTELLEKIDELVERNGGGHYTRHTIFKRVYTVKP